MKFIPTTTNFTPEWRSQLWVPKCVLWTPQKPLCRQQKYLKNSDESKSFSGLLSCPSAAPDDPCSPFGANLPSADCNNFPCLCKVLANTPPCVFPTKIPMEETGAGSDKPLWNPYLLLLARLGIFLLKQAVVVCGSPSWDLVVCFSQACDTLKSLKRLGKPHGLYFQEGFLQSLGTPKAAAALKQWAVGLCSPSGGFPQLSAHTVSPSSGSGMSRELAPHAGAMQHPPGPVLSQKNVRSSRRKQSFPTWT